jgi:hypothetical protein
MAAKLWCVVILGLGASDCEALRDAWLGQPANALSSLAYVAAGLYVWRVAGRAPLALALLAVGVGSLLYHGPMPAGAGVAHDGSIAVLAGTTAFALWRRWLPRAPAITLAAGAAAVAVNVLTRTGAPLCRPDSLLQGHAAWHLLTALALAAWLGRSRMPVFATIPRLRPPIDENAAGATSVSRRREG